MVDPSLFHYRTCLVARVNNVSGNIRSAEVLRVCASLRADISTSSPSPEFHHLKGHAAAKANENVQSHRWGNLKRLCGIRKNFRVSTLGLYRAPLPSFIRSATFSKVLCERGVGVGDNREAKKKSLACEIHWQRESKRNPKVKEKTKREQSGGTIPSIV